MSHLKAEDYSQLFLLFHPYKDGAGKVWHQDYTCITQTNINYEEYMCYC